MSFRKRSFAADRLGSFRLLGQALSPQRFRSEASTFDERAQLGPDEVGMDAAAEAAIGAGNDVLAAGDRGVTQDTVGDQLRVLDEFGGMADDTRHQHLARRQLRGLPDAPLMLVPHVGGLEGIVCAFTPRIRSMMCASGRSCVCGPCQLAQHKW